MSDSTLVKPTATERETARLRARFHAHIHEWWPRYDADFPRKEFWYHITDAPYELWSCELSKDQLAPAEEPKSAELERSGAEPNRDENANGVTLWLLWDKREVTSYDDEGDAYQELINGQKARRLDSTFRYWTSPLTVSAILAVMLLMLISALEVFRQNFPDQLWSIFTACAAFS